MTKQVASKFAVAGLALSAALAVGQTAQGANNTFLYIANPTGNPTPTSSSVTVAPGATVRLDLYLQETVPAGNQNIVNGDNGMFSAGVKISSAAAGSSVITGWLQNTVDFTGPAAINGGNYNPNNPAANPPPSAASPMHTFSFLETTDINAATGPHEGNTGGGAITASANNAADVYVGSVTVTAGAAGSKTDFTIGQYATGGGNTLTFTNFNDLDSSGTQSATLASSGNAQPYTGVGVQSSIFTVNVSGVPEPSSLGLLAAGGLLALRRRRRA